MAILLEVRVIMGALIKSQAFSDLGEEEQVNGLPPLPYLVSLLFWLLSFEAPTVRSCNPINFTARSAGENP